MDRGLSAHKRPVREAIFASAVIPLQKPAKPYGKRAFLCLGLLHIPLDRLHASGPYGADHMVVVFAEGAADQRRTHAGQALNHVVAFVHIRDNLIRGQGAVVVVLGGVVHQLMSALNDGARRIRILLRPCADHKEGRFDAVFIQNIEYFPGVVRPPG